MTRYVRKLYLSLALISISSYRALEFAQRYFTGACCQPETFAVMHNPSSHLPNYGPRLRACLQTGQVKSLLLYCALLLARIRATSYRLYDVITMEPEPGSQRFARKATDRANPSRGKLGRFGMTQLRNGSNKAIPPSAPLGTSSKVRPPATNRNNGDTAMVPCI